MVDTPEKRIHGYPGAWKGLSLFTAPQTPYSGPWKNMQLAIKIPNEEN
jgi:hypothetical protein